MLMSPIPAFGVAAVLAAANISQAIDAASQKGSLCASPLSVQGQDSEGFTEMMNAFGAAWQLDNVTMPPYDLRITAQDGQQVTAM